MSDDDKDCREKAEEVYDLIRCIRDPEKDASLEQLAVVREADVHVCRFDQPHAAAVNCGDECGAVAASTAGCCDAVYLVRVGLTPTVSHCSLATLIGLCVRVRLEENLYFRHKLDVTLKPDAHDTPDEVNKQINDKERVAAAMENPALSNTVRDCISDAQ